MISLSKLIFVFDLVLLFLLSCFRFGGHSMGVTPVLVSITEVKSFCVLFVYYGFSSMGISFRCQPFLSLLTYFN